MSRSWFSALGLPVVLGLALLWSLPLSVGASPPTVHGFVEPALGVRTTDDGPVDERNVMEEVQVMLESQWYGDAGEFLNLRLLGRTNEDGNDETDVSLREGSIFVPLSTSTELTVGRQILSWGPAQFEFINDHFAKDYRSFFIGRDLEFLKAPNDAAKFSWFTDWANLDLVLTPSFDPDVIPEGRVIPVFHPGLGRLVNRTGAPPIREPEDSFDQGEIHLRLYRMYHRWEFALYGYRGFLGTPRGWTGSRLFYPELSSWGFSARGPYTGAVVWVEGSYDDVRHRLAGVSPRVPPDRTHLMTGARYRYTPTLRFMLQATWDHQVDAETYRQRLPAGHPDDQADRFRLQGSVQDSFLQDRLELGSRLFWGITEEDWHLRLTADYEWSDALSLHGGALLFGADQPVSRFGAVQDSDLLFTRLRYGF